MSTKMEIEGYLNEIAARRYGDNDVSQLQHALQCAALAEAEKSSPELITAAFLHDIGHIIDLHYEGAAEAGIDRRHEQTGSSYLAQWFGPAVTEPIRLHVDAKRYLCSVEPFYFDGLSAGSVRSLALQGGPFDRESASVFAAQPFAKDAIKLRRWDDLAKDPDAETAPVAHYLGILDLVLDQTQVA